ncbi:tRNA (carboxymethyluridine(34)-5-O)-methyltransferase isoform X2 [Cryptomeria japonica]|nr:tRNA (carboxymethyluridine(34)-5-O)-methyltransferase isoform X2 [Cryptomeria japonica]XP_057830696.2 tRNA (carboxymethyluridine(34)-5-O)-methyltransferase isoform X2 [Cryptomeria japonica]XP_057830698.2 tRNA (carboxymethyluridine(34)-5-O)-methyltransferase isoform X2 [Cryptomeria japonica]XP_057830699.2 tRNA (carboxymethyluridine(34)-5-O)-methyltransferase isoform X2 [Cryptomeria japonica]
MIEYHQISSVLVFPHGEFLSECSMVTKLNAANGEGMKVPYESQFSDLSDKINGKGRGGICATSNTSPFSRNLSSLNFRNRLPFSFFEKKMTLSSNALPMNSGNLDPATTDGNLQRTQAMFSTQNDKYPVSANFTPAIEKKYVHNVYDAIAPHFSSTRFAKWPKVAKFLDSLTPGSIILDAGCGNGKYLGFNPNCFFIGCDISSSLINICGSRGHEVLVADAINLPYRNGFGDAAISIAVLHHLSTEERRKKAIEELVRIVHKGGKVLITVWAVEQEDRSLLTKWTPLAQKYTEQWVGTTSSFESSSSTAALESIQESANDDSGGQDLLTENNEEHITHSHKMQYPESVEATETKKDIAEGEVSILSKGSEREQQEFFVPWHLPYHRAEVSGTSAQAIASGFAKKDDKKGAVVYNRYYHVFTEGELERLVSGVSNALIVDKFYDKSNWCIIIEKT